MDISTLGSCIAIVMICYIVGMGCKALKKIPDEWIPVIMAVIGGILGAVGMGVIPDFPATDYITAVAVGMFNGLSSTGGNQVIKPKVPQQEMCTGILMFYPALTSLLTREQSLKSTGQMQQTTHSYTSVIPFRMAI